MELPIELDSGAIAAFCRRHHIRRLALFGSILHEGFTPESDVDVLVEFEEGHLPSLFGIVRMENELTALVGRQVDLRTPEDLSRHFRDRVREEALVQYGA